MAYGFGATFGTGTTDRFGFTYTPTNKWALSLWLYANGVGGSNFGRVTENAGGTNSGFIMRIGNGSGTSDAIIVERWATTSGRWWLPQAIRWKSWVHIVAQQDTLGMVQYFINGYRRDDVVEQSTPSGTPTNTTAVMSFGNRTSQDRVWDGMIEEYAIWNRLLLPEEIQFIYRCGIQRGRQPFRAADGLVVAFPLRTANDPLDYSFATVVGGTPKLQGTVPRSIVPPRRRFVQAAPGATWLQADDPYYQLVQPQHQGMHSLWGS